MITRGNVSASVAILAAWLLLASPVAATPPLTDRLDFEEASTNMWTGDGKWLEVPRSDKLQQMRRAEQCSATGGPKPRWRVSDGKLWLVGFHRCAGDLPLTAIYDDATGQPILADWVTAELVTNRGPYLCNSGPYGPAVFATTVRLKIEGGVVKDIARLSNTDHPRVPKDRVGDRVPPCVRINK